MKYLAAYMLAVLGGNASPSADDVKGILGSCGIEAESDTLDRLISAVGGKDINEIVSEGMSKLSSVPSGSGGGGAGGGGGSGAVADEAPQADKEEAKEESEDEEDNDMGFDLFD